LKTIFAVSENYPELKANTNFMELQRQLERMEDKLQAARRSYNAAIKDFRNRKEQFPSNIVAGSMTLPSYEMYEIDASETKNPSVAEAFGQ
jgi:LemA protein